MATGPEHYRNAERILSETTIDLPPVLIQQQLMAAQIHATLALAAATAISGHQGHKWHAVAGATITTSAVPTDAFDAFTDAQLDGTDCASCGKTFVEGEPTRPTTVSPRGQMFVCAGLYCKAVA